MLQGAMTIDKRFGDIHKPIELDKETTPAVAVPRGSNPLSTMTPEQRKARIAELKSRQGK